MVAKRRPAAPKITAAERAYFAIRQAVIDGRFEAGEHLAEIRLGEEFGLSRTPVHTALLRLAAEGFVEVSPHSGAVVKHWSLEEMAEIFAVRAQLESMAASLAATNATAQDVAHLAHLTDEYEAASRGGAPMPRPSELNWQFHTAILKIAGNSRLRMIAEHLMIVGVMYRAFSQFERRDVERSLQDHRILVRAIETGDAEWAGAVMKGHVLVARDLFSTTGSRAANGSARHFGASANEGDGAGDAPGVSR